MGKKIKKDILKQIENILKDYNELKATFEPLEYLSLLGKDQDEITKINGLITKIKALISSNFDEDSPFYKQVELHSKGRSGMCGRSELSIVIADLKVINNELLKRFKSIKESKRIKVSIKRLFVFLNKNNIYDFLSTGEIIDALMEIDLDGFWEENIYELNEVIAIHDELQYIDVYKEIFIKLLTKELENNKDNFIREIDHIVNALISHYNIQDFDYNEFKKRILDCGFNQEDISQMECLKNKRLSKMFEGKVKMNIEAIRKQVEEILVEYNKFNASYQPVIFPSLEQMIKINEIILKTKAFIIAYFKGTPYEEQVEYYGNRKDKYGLDNVISILTVLNDNLNKQQTTIKKNLSALKFDIILEEKISDNTYEEVIKEINGTYIDHYFASMYIMMRKLLENLIYDCLKKYYDTDVDKYYNTLKGQHQGFGTLIENFNRMIKETRFKKDIGDIEHRFIDLLKKFQEKGNKDAHSLFNLPHQDFIEGRKDKINNLIKKLDWVLQKL